MTTAAERRDHRGSARRPAVGCEPYFDEAGGRPALAIVAPRCWGPRRLVAEHAAPPPRVAAAAIPS